MSWRWVILCRQHVYDVVDEDEGHAGIRHEGGRLYLTRYEQRHDPPRLPPIGGVWVGTREGYDLAKVLLHDVGLAQKLVNETVFVLVGADAIADGARRVRRGDVFDLENPQASPGRIDNYSIDLAR